VSYAGGRLQHVHIADRYNHRADAGQPLHIINPPSTDARIHQLGSGKVAWDEFFATLREMSFDGVATVCMLGLGPGHDRTRECVASL
jgi:myo-inositol catabolism protein IolH